MTSPEPSGHGEAKQRSHAKSSPRKTLYILNGPNLDLLGERETELYGRQTLAAIEEKCSKTAKGLGIEIVFRQTNEEGTLVDWIHEARVKAMGIVINAAAYAAHFCRHYGRT